MTEQRTTIYITTLTGSIEETLIQQAGLQTEESHKGEFSIGKIAKASDETSTFSPSRSTEEVIMGGSHTVFEISVPNKPGTPHPFSTFTQYRSELEQAYSSQSK